jgi:tetratricopeptide (TPR) repeat protein
VRLIALLLAVAVTSASASNDRALLLLDGWIKSVDQHSAGESDEALARLTDWTYNDLELMRGYVEALVGLPLNTRARDNRRSIVGRDFAAIKERVTDLKLRGRFDDFMKRAAILHTDAALLGSMPLVVEPPTSLQQPRWARGSNQRSVNVKSFDGRVENFELRNLHWDFAMDVLEALPAAPRRDPIVAQWYRAIGAFFVSERQFADAFGHFNRGRQLVPDDPQVMFGEACFNEALGAPRLQNYVKVTTLPGGLTILGVESPQAHWRRAEDLLRRSVAIDPAFTEAQLRLGRILVVLGRHDEGLKVLQRALADAPDYRLRYFAHLFSGDAQQSLGRVDDAQRSYERALELYPDAQAARMGLASALRSTGGDALAALLPVLETAPGSHSHDPWWDYYDGDAAQVPELLEQLRAPFTSPRR